MNVLRLIPEQGGEPIIITQDQLLVGRDAASDIHLKDASVSRQHAEIRKEADEWVITDLNSGNGTLINGVRTTQALLLPGQNLQFGNVCFRVEIDRGDDGSTVILGRSPFAGLDKTIVRGPMPPSAWPPTPAPPDRSRLILPVAVGAFVVLLSLGLLAVIYRSRQRATPPRSTRVVQSLPVTPAPVAATPAPAPSPSVVVVQAAPRRGTLLISSDTQAVFSVDGRQQRPIPAGGMRLIEVSPGEHIVSFGVGQQRHDQLVRAAANEQSVVRFSDAGTTVSTAPAVSMPASTPAAVASAIPARTPDIGIAPPAPSLAPATPIPMAAARITPAPTAAPVAPNLADEGLVNGVAAVARGDFYRALLILKDVTRRLENDPRAGKELARAYAYLAWTYHSLDRAADALAAADKAVRADPGVTSNLGTFPPQVVSLFKRPR